MSRESMSNLKHKLPIWIMGLFTIMAVISVLFLWDPEHGKALLTGANPGGGSWNPVTVVLGTLVHLLILVSWLYLMFGKEKLRSRLHWFWTPFGILMIIWVWLTVYNAAIVERGWVAVLQQSEVPWYAISFGLLFAFYSLKSVLRPFWCVLWTFFWMGLVMYGSELLRALGVITFESGYLVPSQAGMFWNYWGWFFADMIVIPIGFVAMYYIFKWRRSVLEKRGERHARFWAFWEGIGLPWVLAWEGLKRAFRKK